LKNPAFFKQIEECSESMDNLGEADDLSTTVEQLQRKTADFSFLQQQAEESKDGSRGTVSDDTLVRLRLKLQASDPSALHQRQSEMHKNPQEQSSN